MIDVALIESLLLVAARFAWPVLGVELLHEDELKRVAGAIMLVGTLVYHAYRRWQGRKPR